MPKNICTVFGQLWGMNRSRSIGKDHGAVSGVCVPFFEGGHQTIKVGLLSRIGGEVVELAGVVLEVVEFDERW
jgi:hypothetical protein